MSVYLHKIPTSFDGFLAVTLSKLLNKHSSYRWWRWYDLAVIYMASVAKVHYRNKLITGRTQRNFSQIFFSHEHSIISSATCRQCWSELKVLRCNCILCHAYNKRISSYREMVIYINICMHGNTFACRHVYHGLILYLRPANERRRYFVTTSLIGWT